MNSVRRLLCSDRAVAAVEMALVAPLLLIIMMGSFELGNYFLDEHALVKGVRDGARFAARLPFSYYTACSGPPAAPPGDPRDPVAETKNVVMTGLTSGGTRRLAKWSATTIAVTHTCSTSAGGTPLSGIYRSTANGAPVVTVSASVPYVPILQSFGFRGTNYSLNAKQYSAVMGI